MLILKLRAHMDPLVRKVIRIGIPLGECYAMGPGKADLLEAIQATASIAAAGRKLGLSYWKTRHLLEEMNQCFRSPVVATSKGGEKGGGAQVTETGRAALAQFRAMEDEAGRAIADRAVAFQALLADPD